MSAVWPQNVGVEVPLDDYCNIVEVQSACINLAAKYSGLATLIPLPNPTHEHNRTHALRIGGAQRRPSKPVFMAIGGLHANEWGSCEILLNLAADLLGSYSGQLDLAYGPNQLLFRAHEVRQLLDAIDVVVLPLVNPDGRRYSQTVSPRWRKNRNPANRTSRDDDSIGVDINRNFDFLFDIDTAFLPGTGIAASKNPLDGQYQGPHAFSEPEALNVRWLLDQHPHTRWFVDLHCKAQGILYPWGHDEVQHTDPTLSFANAAHDGQRGMPGDAYQEYQAAADVAEMQRLAQAYAAAVHAASNTVYDAVQGFTFTPVCGTSHDWVYARSVLQGGPLRTMAFAIEWYGAGTDVRWSEMPKIMADVTAGLIAMGRAVLPQP